MRLSLSLSLSASLSLSHSPSASLTLSQPLSLSLSLSQPLSLSLTLPHPLSASLSLSHPLSASLSLAYCLTPSLARPCPAVVLRVTDLPRAVPIVGRSSRLTVKFMGEASEESGNPHGEPTSFLAQRSVLELCNYLMLASIDADALATTPSTAAARKANLSSTTARFRAHVAGEVASWHPDGDKIPRFSPRHCSTGSVLLVQAMLTCRHVSLYGYHACSCARRCADPAVAARNHYWDKKETPRFGEMMSRYEHHMLLYQRLQHACDVDFRIARTEHCDSIL